MGAHILAIKDMAGLCKPYAAEKLVKALREEVGIPDSFPHARHQRHQRGVDSEGGRSRRGRGRRRHRVDERHDQPAESELDRGGAGAHAARHRARSRRAQRSAPITGRWCASTTRRSTRARSPARPKSTCTKCRAASTPISRSRPSRMGLGARWPEIARTYAEVNLAFGDIVKVTPSSKVVGDMAIFLVSHGMTVQQFEQLDAGPQPDAADSRGRDVHRARWASPRAAGRRSCRRSFCAARSRSAGRPGAHLPPVESGGDRGSGREEDRPQAVARRGAELPDVPGRVPEVRARAAELGRRGRAADAAVLLRHGARRGDRGRTRAGQDAGRSSS